MIRKRFPASSQPPDTARRRRDRRRTLAVENLEPRTLLSVGAVGPNSLITTVAGNGIPGYFGDASAATTAELKSPGDVAFDSAGDLFIVDELNYRIREVNAATGIITTIAGSGIKESQHAANGDGTAAIKAQIAPTGGIAVDAAGDVFFAEAGMNRVREVNSATGLISTVAGNGGGSNGYLDQLKGPPPATAVGVQDPSGLAIDAAGDLFISEYLSSGNSDVREVYSTIENNQSVRVITTVAGVSYDAPTGAFNGQATTQFLYGPRGIALDGNGHLFIADAGDEFIARQSSVIREVNLASGAISTVAGSGSTGFTADGGPATAADLNNPVAVVADGAGHVFIADDSYFSDLPAEPETYNDNRILEINLSSRTIATVAGQFTGNGAATTSGDNGPASAAVLNVPTGLAMDSAGDLYVADSGDQRIRAISATLSVSSLPTPSFTLGGSSLSTFSAGQNVTIQWSAMGVNPAGPTKISLGYDADATPFDANQHWIEMDAVTAAVGAGSYVWNTAGVAAGTYYLDGCMCDLSTQRTVYSHVSTPIVVVPPVFTLTAPAAGSIFAGQSMTFRWSAANVDTAGSSKITLGYDPDATAFDAAQRWIEIDQISASNGAGTYVWNTTGVATGTYHLDGYMVDFASGRAVYSQLSTAIVVAPPAFTLAASSARTYAPGQIVTFQWTVAGADVAAGAKITLGYDRDSTPFDANQHWIEINGLSATAADGAGAYGWNTSGMAAGTYYLDGYLYDAATHQSVYASLAKPIVIT